VILIRRALSLASIALLAACAKTVQVPTAPPFVTTPPATTQPPVVLTPPPPPTARAAGIRLVPPSATIDEISAARALNAFRISCPVLVLRTDSSQLSVGPDWAQVCADALTVLPGGAGAFFRDRFDWVQVADGKAFATGYYEPTILGSRMPQPGYAPIYGVPADLVRCTRPDEETGRGRVDPATGLCGPYFSRAEIDDGALANRGAEIAWAADPLELFFVEIQGSARVVFPDGSSIRIGYAEQNGLPYTPIGRVLRERGILPAGGASMQAIKDWIRANPDQGRALLRENQSYIFFKASTGPGPLGSLNAPLTPHGTVAADPKFVPLGAPVFLTMDRPEPNGLWVAQDVGGAIKGSNRFDTFWGGGSEAETLAGGMAAKGQAFVLLPKGVAARALAQP
jgi:membrane-bound lytic murein transglycosylase A